ncbi:hypothetical protein NQ318_009713 [Aromia moschata]|uniref:Cytochrome P450 n=1 Tax=Aromia moschata TaxID=1265417 RepID=A0AAV8XZK8_9CUCU|nr:hypothetical protein NQ318_009713 [Aromia moschata]
MPGTFLTDGGWRMLLEACINHDISISNKASWSVVPSHMKSVHGLCRAGNALAGQLLAAGGTTNIFGLICAEGELWKEQRRFVHHCLRQFGGSKIGVQRKKMESLIMEHVLDFVEHMKTLGDRPVDPLEVLRHNLGSAINIIVFGKCWSRYDETWKWLQSLQEEGTQHIGVAGPLNFLPFLRFLPKFNHTMNFLIDGKRKTHELYQKIIDEQAEWLKKHNPDGICCTWQNTLPFKKGVRSEMQDVLQNRPPSIDDLPHLPLVEASIYETQRIRSVVPVGIPHGAVTDVEVGGFHIPKGTMLVPLQWAIHMNENVWVKPEQFNPWRFVNEEGKVVKGEHFMPYQIGKRMCVGDELARMLLFLFGATIIQNFELTLERYDADLTGECGITLTPKPHRLIFSEIPRQSCSTTISKK